MIVNFYTSDGTFLNGPGRSGIERLLPIGTEVKIENPSGFVYSGLVTSVAADLWLGGEYAIILEGKWEWES